MAMTSSRRRISNSKTTEQVAMGAVAADEVVGSLKIGEPIATAWINARSPTGLDVRAGNAVLS